MSRCCGAGDFDLCASPIRRLMEGALARIFDVPAFPLTASPIRLLMEGALAKILVSALYHFFPKLIGDHFTERL